MVPPLEQVRDIRLLVLDVDGVLTDGGLYFGAGGEALKRFHVHDGAGIRALLAAGIHVAVITGRSSPATSARMAELGVAHLFQGVKDKAAQLGQLLTELELNHGQVACVADDQAELAMMSGVRLAVAVADAHPSVLEAAHWRTQRAGGCGAVREVCDLLLTAAGP